MTGWRLGYAIGAHDVIAKMNKLQQHINTNSCTFVQVGACSIYKNEPVHIKPYVDELEARINYFDTELNKLPYITGVKPKAGFFYFIDISAVGVDSNTFCADLLKKTGIASTPGVAFGPEWDDHVRFSIAVPISTLERAVELMKGYSTKDEDRFNKIHGSRRYPVYQRWLDKEIKDRYEFVVPEEFTEDGICAVCSGADILLGPYVTKKIVETAGDLKLIQVPWTGMDTFDFSSVQGITVPICNTHSNADSVAEIGVAIVLDLLKKVSYHDRKMRAGNWNRDQKPLNLKSKMLNKQTVCVLGFGNIGSRIGKLIAAFGAKVIAVDGHAKAGEIASEVYRMIR
jgi:hypothetical protein